MKKNKMKEYGHLATAISSHSSSKPLLDISARMSDGMGGPDDQNWRKERVKDLRKAIKAGHDEISSFDHQEAGERVLKSLKSDIAQKQAQLMEHEAALGIDNSEGEEGADTKGSVVGGPYKIIKSGSVWQIKNMETGKVKGTHDSRAKALRQFRLLEGIEHGMTPRKK